MSRRIGLRHLAPHGVPGVGRLARGRGLRCHVRARPGVALAHAVGVGGGGEPAHPVVGVGDRARGGARLGEQVAFAVVDPARGGAVGVGAARHAAAAVPGHARHVAVGARGRGHMPGPVVGVGAVLVGGEGVVGPVGARHLGAVGVLDGRRAPAAVVAVGGGAPGRVGRAGEAAAVGDGVRATGQVYLLHHPVRGIVGVLHHAAAVGVVPGGHAPRGVVLVAHLAPGRVGEARQVPRPVVAVAQLRPARQRDGRDEALGVAGDGKPRPRRGRDGGDAAGAVALDFGGRAGGLRHLREPPVAVELPDGALAIGDLPAVERGGPALVGDLPER